MLVSVRSRSALGRTRAGLRFGKLPRVVDVSDAQLRAIEADAALIVEPCDDDTPVTPEPRAQASEPLAKRHDGESRPVQEKRAPKASGKPGS